MKRAAAILAIMSCCFSALPQEGVMTFGLQFRPLIPNEFVNFREVEGTDEGLSAVWRPRPSINFGGVIRYGITRAFSIESGINLVRRNFLVDIAADDLRVSGSVRNAFVGYEIPIQGLYYVQLGDKLWMNASGGICMDMYPSNTFSAGNAQVDTTFYSYEQFTSRRRWIQAAIQANYGFEYRTKSSGYFYFGATYHRPFSRMAWSEAVLRWQGGIRRSVVELSGTYFTIDLRYFFHEDPDRKK